MDFLVITYLQGSKDVIKSAPVYYIIQPIVSPIPTNRRTYIYEMIYHAPRLEEAYNHDNKKVHEILDTLVVGTAADIWAKLHKRTKNCRSISLAIYYHYGGPVEDDKCITIARSNLNTLFYKNKASFHLKRSHQKYDSVFLR